MNPRTIASYARLVVPLTFGVLAGFALNASWHAIQKTLRDLGAPTELVLALPIVLEPSAVLYAGVWITRRRVGGDVRVPRALFFTIAAIALAYNGAAALPLGELLLAGSSGRVAVLVLSGMLAPATVITVGHTALEEWDAWRASRRSLVDDIHEALEAMAQKELAEQVRGEFADEVREKVLVRLRADMEDRLGDAKPRRKRRSRSKPEPSESKPVAGETVRLRVVPSTNGHPADGDGGSPVGQPEPVPAGGSGVTAAIANRRWADEITPLIRQWEADGRSVTDSEFRGYVLDRVDRADSTVDKWLSIVRDAAKTTAGV